LHSEQFYQFGNFHLAPTEHLLLRDSQPVPLTPKTFDLLVFLVEHRGHLLTKDEILDAVWQGSFVEEANLTVSISALRKALGEKRGETQYIDTVPKKGYRFTAEVAEFEASHLAGGANRRDAVDASHESEATTLPAAASEESAHEAARKAPLRPAADSLSTPSAAVGTAESAPRIPKLAAKVVAAVCIAAALVAGIGWWRWMNAHSQTAASKRLAVLPFQNLRHDPDTDFLGFSLADAIINRLGYVSELTVRPSYAVRRYRTETPDLQKVAKDLSVDTLLTGSFIRDGESLRVSYQLVDSRSNRIVRRGTMDLKYENMLAIQDNVSGQVITALALPLSPSEAEHFKTEPPIPPLAYEYYLRGVDLYSRNDFLTAIQMLQKSAEIYPGYALTWAHLGRSYTAGASFRFGGAELYRKAQAAYERALALQPTLSLARIYMANLLTDTGRPEEAVPLLRETLATNPNLAEAHWELGYAYRYGGMLEGSVKECNRARELDPNVKLTTSANNGYLYLGKYDMFLQSLPQLNDSAFVEFYRGFTLYHMHQWNDAAAVLDHAYQLDPSLLQTQVGKALTFAIHHQNKEGLAVLNATEGKITMREVGDPEAIYKLAQAYAELGDTVSALRIFRHSVANGFFPYPYFVKDPLMDKVRRQAEFQKDLETARQRSEAFRRQVF
jgi:DNA-binding winged helix-turn-helix (wHTH) protein/TolB-like protein